MQKKEINQLKDNHITKKIILKGLFHWILISVITGLLFYNNLWISCILLFLFPYYLKKQKKLQIEKEQFELEIAFQDALQSLTSALEAGYSVENSLNEIIKDLKIIYPKDTKIIIEFEFMKRQIENNISIETVFLEFANRTRLEDIESFAEVFLTAKRTGGDIVKIAKTTCTTIAEKTEVLQEIQTMITAKKFETKIMKLVPYIMLSYFRLFSPDYLDVLYGNLAGIILMSILLLLYQGANILARTIIEIEI